MATLSLVTTYKISEADGFVSLDKLITSHGVGRVRDAVDVWDTENGVEFSVASVKNVDREGSVALLSFVGYPLEFDDWTPLSFGTHARYRQYGEELQKFLHSTGDSLRGLYGVIDDDEAQRDAPKKRTAGTRARSGGTQSAKTKRSAPGRMIEVVASAYVDLDLAEDESFAHVDVADVAVPSEHDDGSDGEFVMGELNSQEAARDAVRQGTKLRSSAMSEPLDDTNVAAAVAGIASATKEKSEKFLALSKDRKKPKKNRSERKFGQLECFFTSVSATVYKCRLCEAEVQVYTKKKKDTGELVVQGSNLVSHLTGKAHADKWERAKEKLKNKDIDVVTSYIETLCAAHEKDGREQGKTQATMDTVLRRGDGSRIDVNFAYMAHLVQSQISFNSVESESFKDLRQFRSCIRIRRLR